jgi:hypothetical protein
MKSSKLLENYVTDEHFTNQSRRVDNCSKNQNIANIKSIRNMNNISDKNEDSIEEMPSPEATPIRMQQREFIKDIRATAPVESIISIK